jgi:RNA polymerase sigma-70 factor, ECF subfamily
MTALMIETDLPYQRVYSALMSEIPRLRRFGRNMIGDLNSADALIEICLRRVIANIAGMRNRANLYLWLLNTFMDIYQQASAEKKVSRSRFRAGEQDYSVRMTTKIEAALQHLPADDRAVLLLVSTEGLTYEQAAEVLETSTTIVKQRLCRARFALKASMAAAPVGVE